MIEQIAFSVSNPGVEQRQRAKDLICQLVAAAGGTLNYMSRLHAAFYLAHIYFFEEEGFLLTAYPIVHTPAGPGIDQPEELLQELEAEGRISCKVQPYWKGSEYLLQGNEPPPYDKNSRGEAIYRAVQKVKSMGANELQEWLRAFSRSWRESSPGEDLDIYLDLLNNEEYARLGCGLEESSMEVMEAFSAAPIG